VEFVGKLCKITTAFCTNQIRNGAKGVCNILPTKAHRKICHKQLRPSCPCLMQVKGLKTMCQFVWTATKLESLSVTLEMAHALEGKTKEQDESDLWHSLGKKKKNHCKQVWSSGKKNMVNETIYKCSTCSPTIGDKRSIRAT